MLTDRIFLQHKVLYVLSDEYYGNYGVDEAFKVTVWIWLLSNVKRACYTVCINIDFPKSVSSGVLRDRSVFWEPFDIQYIEMVSLHREFWNDLQDNCFYNMIFDSYYTAMVSQYIFSYLH